MIRDKLLNADKTQDQIMLDDYALRMTNTTFNKVFRFFKGISKPTASGIERPIHETFILETSLKENLESYFGHQCDFISERMFNMLSDGVPMRRIYFREFLEKFYWPLFTDQTNHRQKLQIVFNMLDLDKDGILTSNDLLTSWELVPPASKFGLEIAIFLEHYYTHVLRV
jgi:hypothetical protein